MDSSENGSLQCDTIQVQSPSVADAEVQLDLNDDSKSESDELETSFQNGFTELNMKLPVAVQSCVPSGLQVSSELVVITNTGTSYLNEQKLPISTYHSVDGTEPVSKRICIEQDGQTYILALQDGMDGLTGVMEIQPKCFPAVETAQVLSCQDSNNLQVKQGINQNWFTSREDKTTLHNKGHIWRQGMWSKEEIELLQSNIHQYCEEHDITNPAKIVFEMSKDERKDFYRTVAKGLNRPLFSVYRRVIRMYDNKNHVGKYTSEELETLKKLRSVYGNDWQRIGSAMGRSASSIKDRCRLMKDNCNQGKWLPAEEQRLAEAVYDLANALPGEMVSTGLSWAVVADRVGTRSEKQCRTKWLNYLNWKVAGGTEWTREDDLTLICRVYALNASDENHIDWTELSKGWLSVRSPQWLRGKWWSLKRHVPNSNDISFNEICECLYQQFVLKVKLKEESSSSTTDNPTNSVDLQSVISRPKPTMLQSVAIPSAPSPSGIVVTAAAQACTTPVVSLTDAQCVDVVNSSATLTPVRIGGPLLHTLEVIPQNIQLATNPQTFLLATPAQQTLPLATAIPPNQIIIQTMTAESIQRSENVTVQVNPHVIMNTSNSTTLTSLASTQVPSVPSSPTNVETDPLNEESSPLSENGFDNQPVESCVVNQDAQIETDDPENVFQNNPSTHYMLSDPMLAVSQSPEAIISSLKAGKVQE